MGGLLAILFTYIISLCNAMSAPPAHTYIIDVLLMKNLVKNTHNLLCCFQSRQEHIYLYHPHK